MHWSIGDMVLDLVQNSVEAGATVIELAIDERDRTLDIMIRDDGCGMDEDRRAAALDPFYTEPGKHPGRRVGLGLPFLLQTVDQTGGNYHLHSEPGNGTELRFRLDVSHVDTPPVGPIPGLLVDLMCFDSEYDLEVERSCNGRSYRIARSELQDVLGDITSVAARRIVLEFLENWEDDVRSVAVPGSEPEA